MEPGEQLSGASSPPHGAPNPESSAKASDGGGSQPGRGNFKTNDHRARSSWIESGAVELYCQALLSRAHFLFFNSIPEDVDFRTDLFIQGKETLEQAEALCMSDRYSVSEQLMAKCWYIRGFLADVGGDRRGAADCFEQATRLDANNMYANLKRVRWYRQWQENGQELGDMWSSDIDRPSERGRPLFHHALGEVEPNDGLTRAGTSNSHDSRNSALFDFLKLDITSRPRPQDSRSREAAPTPLPLPLPQPTMPTTPTTLHHSPPIETPPHARAFGAVDLFMKQLIEEPSKAIRRASEETHKILMQHVNSPEKDASLLAAAREDRRRAMQEAAAREQIKRLREQLETRRESTAKKTIRRPSRPLADEALLSDTPGIGELDTRFTVGDRSAGSPISPISPTLRINTRGVRKSSTPGTPSSGPSGPSGPSSPLRQSAFPVDVDEEEEGQQSVPD
ncbi:hypothetical protein G647_07553 [Cladophialophora carrionii CBS 160.54]|uniref:Uncharacterized protein n=1 Tax=Cladophialophora carrionii CBS 160.54 TaxID=1279043 RepID=V9D4I9_9EURO|nr:uncharacterized protein G647_07553 [Cladophialophora carrionii CBS 160.54]ETI21208.1 hypothetical protein G647_07553 [Cladophialophora carrionii CBS 160.54]